MQEWLILVLAGISAGVISGLLGVGGGIIMVPALHYIIGIPFVEATALSLFAIMLQSPVGIWQHSRRKAVDWKLGGLLAFSGAVGVLVGRWLQPALDVEILKVIFGMVMVLAAWRLVAHVRNKVGQAAGNVTILLVGLLAGMLSRLLGIGGGILTVPALVFFGFAPHVAVASSLLPVFTNALLASAIWLWDGLDPLRAIPLAIAAAVGAPLGVWIAHRLPAKRLRKVIGVAVGLAGALVIVTSGAFV